MLEGRRECLGVCGDRDMMAVGFELDTRYRLLYSVPWAILYD